MNYRRFIWILPFITLSQVSHAIQLDEECISEPVFEGKVCVYQANRESKQVVILVHGIGDNASRDWSEQIEPLARDFRVVTLDLPGFGNSERGDNLYSPQNYVAILRFVTEHYGLSRFDLVGHSMGAAVSLLYAAEFPQQVNRLVVVDVAGILHRVAIGKYVVAGKLNDDRDEVNRTESYVVKIIEKLGGLYSFFSDGAAENSEHVRAGIELADFDFSPVLKKLKLPVLIVWGKNDPIAPLRTAMVLQKRIQNTHMEVIDGAGHVPMREKSEEFNMLLMAFLHDSMVKKPPATAHLPAEYTAAERVGVCNRERGKYFSGHFMLLKIENCSDVVIRNADVDELIIYESRVNIENSVIGGAVEIAMDVVGSDIKMTASEIDGDVGVKVARSRLDLAAVDLYGKQYSVKVVSGTRMIFSLSSLNSEYSQRPIHDVVALDVGGSL